MEKEEGKKNDAEERQLLSGEIRKSDEGNEGIRKIVHAEKSYRSQRRREALRRQSQEENAEVESSLFHFVSTV
jgi:hypothetical protein